MPTHIWSRAALALVALCPALAAQEIEQDILDTAYVAGEYRVFTGAGQPATLEDVVAAMGASEVVFVGETHDDPTGHALELELLSRAHLVYGSSRPLALSLEFFQRDVQPILDEYLADVITEKAFLDDGRPWPRYDSDYRSLIEHAKSNQVPVIAANAPRRYANRVGRLGRASLDDLGAGARATLAPLPYGEASAAYRDQWIQTIMAVMEEEQMKCGKPIVDTTAADTGAAHGGHQSAHANMGNQLDSQVLWDATMAYWVNDHLVRAPDALVLHMVGSFHVARGTGIPEQLERYRPGTRSMIVMLRPVADVETFEPAPSGVWGDFVIQTDESRTLQAIECRVTE
jgi:uncharacterized iron-regulated protein